MQTKISFLVSSLLFTLFFSDLFSHAADVFTPFLFVSRRREVEFLKTNSYLVFEESTQRPKGRRRIFQRRIKKRGGWIICCKKRVFLLCVLYFYARTAYLYYSAFDQSNFSHIERNSLLSFSNLPGANFSFFEEEFFFKRPPKISIPKSRFQRDSSSIACK